jgi:hypothetical protein
MLKQSFGRDFAALGGFIPASHTMFYGFNIERMYSYVFAGTSFATFRNNSWDNHHRGRGEH